MAAGKNPDGILYDPYSKRVFAFNGRSNDVTAIGAASGKVAGTVALDGKPEFPVSDRKGNIYVNIEDKSEIVQLDPRALKIKKTWSLSPCEEPSGLAIDEEARRLFSVCSNKKMAIVNADSGQVVATVAIGDGPDAAAGGACKSIKTTPLMETSEGLEALRKAGTSGYRAPISGRTASA